MYFSPAYRRPARRSAFTLIELLVVISIIALLVALLLPALSRARTSAQMAQALSNARQIQIALQNYAYQNDGTIPYRSVKEGGLSTKYWAGRLMRFDYIADIDVFWSPGRDTRNISKKAALKDWDNGNWRYVGYGLNDGASRQPTVDSNGDPDPGSIPSALPLNLDTGNAPPPSEFVSLVDFWVSPDDNGTVDPTSKLTAGLWFSDGGLQGNRYYQLFTYNGGVARSYFDGHASGSDSRALGWEASSQYQGQWQYTDYSFHQEAPWYTKWYK